MGGCSVLTDRLQLSGRTTYCNDGRCGEGAVTPVAHPDDPTGLANRCPTCLSTISLAPTTVMPPVTLSADLPPDPRDA